MHRRKTKFAHRVNRVGTALERRGIRATYELHDRILSNRRSRRLWAGDHVDPDAVQQRILDELRRSGLLAPHVRRASSRSGALAGSGGDAGPVRGRDRGRPRSRRGAGASSRGQGVRRAPPQLRRGPGSRRSLAQGLRLATDARRRKRVPTHVVETRVHRRLVLRPAAGRGRPDLVTALAPRLQRQAPAEGVPPPRGRRRRHGPVPVRPGEPARWPVRGRLALELARPELPLRGGAGAADPELGRADVHGPEGLAPLLQHGRFPPRRLLDQRPPRARDRDLLVAGLARVVD